MGNKLTDKNRLSITHPELCKEWDYEKNGDLRPENVSVSSGKKVWWKCEHEKHEWETTISHRSGGSKCPYCSGQLVSDKNRLSIVHPELCEEWDYEKNGDLRPEDVSYASSKKIWWICKKYNHRWLSSCCNRSRGSGCPYCSGNLACDNNSLVFNKPLLLAEWNYNKNIGIDVNKLTVGSNKKVWWICCNLHEWEATIYERSNGSKCPQCARIRSSPRVTSPNNNVLNNFPDIAKEWDYDKNNKLPENFSSCNSAKVWWKCSVCLNGWEARIDSRTKSKSGCPYCSGRNATDLNNLFVQYPLLCKEWDYDKNKIGPEKYKSKSSVKVWWKCSVCGGEWETSIYHRTSGTGCPYCNKIILKDGCICDSLTEAYVFLEYKKNNIVFEQHKRYPNSRMKCDFFIPAENKYVEVTGYHSKSISSLSTKYFSYIEYLRKIVTKKHICKSNGFNFDFLKIELTPSQIYYVRENMLNNKNIKKVKINKRVPWTKEEDRELCSLYEVDKYWWKAIATRLNIKYHENKPIRSRKSVSNHYNRIKQQMS